MLLLLLLLLLLLKVLLLKVLLLKVLLPCRLCGGSVLLPVPLLQLLPSCCCSPHAIVRRSRWHWGTALAPGRLQAGTRCSAITPTLLVLVLRRCSTYPSAHSGSSWQRLSLPAGRRRRCRCRLPGASAALRRPHNSLLWRCGMVSKARGLLALRQGRSLQCRHSVEVLRGGGRSRWYYWYLCA